MQHDRDQVARSHHEVASRLVVDEQGHEWTVHEVDTPQAWAHAARCLIFSSPAVVRRVWRYPADWSGRSTRELLELLGDTAPA